MSTIAAGFVPTVCNFSPVTRISCDVYAVNGAGRSPTAVSSIYIAAKGWFRFYITSNLSFLSP